MFLTYNSFIETIPDVSVKLCNNTNVQITNPLTNKDNLEFDGAGSTQRSGIIITTIGDVISNPPELTLIMKGHTDLTNEPFYHMNSKEIPFTIKGELLEDCNCIVNP